MIFSDVQAKLVSLFEPEKLDGRVDAEWGFTGKPGKDIAKIGCATNLTPETIRQAAKNRVDMMLTHHDAWPFVYGMKEQCLALLAERDISHAFFHAPLDDAAFGTSASLAVALGLKNTRRAIPYEGIYLAGVVGTLETPAAFQPFASQLSDILGEPVRAFQNNSGPVQKVCVVTGAGNMTNDIQLAANDGCDTYITGEYNLYSQQYAKFAGIHLLVGSHTNTEISGVLHLAEKLVENTGMEAVRLSEENY